MVKKTKYQSSQTSFVRNFNNKTLHAQIFQNQIPSFPSVKISSTRLQLPREVAQRNNNDPRRRTDPLETRRLEEEEEEYKEEGRGGGREQII